MVIKNVYGFLLFILLLTSIVGCTSSGEPKIIVGVRYSNGNVENVVVSDKASQPPLQTIAYGSFKITITSNSGIFASESFSRFDSVGYRAVILKLNKEPTKGEMLNVKVELLKNGMITDTSEIKYEWK